MIFTKKSKISCNCLENKYKVFRSFMSQGSSVVEQRPEKPCVGSSILPLGTTKNYREKNGRVAQAVRAHL